MSEASEHLEEGRRLTEKVDELVQQGKSPQARSALAKGWQDAAPELPLRYPIVLENIATRTAKYLAVVLSAAKREDHLEDPELVLELSGSRTPRASVRYKGARLGDLPSAQVQFLGEISEYAALYKPRLIAIRVSETGIIGAVEIEMVRPEAPKCPICGQEHSPGGSCEKTVSSQEQEVPPTSLQEAIDVIVVEEHKAQFTIREMLDRIDGDKGKRSR